MEALLSKEKQFELAGRFFELAEEVGRTVDKLLLLIGDEQLKQQHANLYAAAENVRRQIFWNSCNYLDITEEARTRALEDGGYRE
jgi:hypothetical protein